VTVEAGRDSLAATKFLRQSAWRIGAPIPPFG
jgi:hypothetical protein